MNINSLKGIALATALFTTTTLAAQNRDSVLNNLPTYNGTDLEMTVSDAGTFWRLWSPEAEEVRVMLYDAPTGGQPLETLTMTKDTQGTWVATKPEQLYGKFYTFQIKHNGKWLAETPGAWAKAVGTNGKRAYVLDLDTTDPEGWQNDRGPKVDNITDVIIYEMHHRDMSAHTTAGSANPGKFLALTEHGTHNLTGEKTGIDHLKELGVTHVHILPSYDFGSIDESKPDSSQYNWGYDPVNYNAPEGSYSTDASSPEVRIKEMKQMIKALHDAGIGVIMDVVYNHTFTGDGSNFSLTAPDYYYRHRPDGSYSDASGCGNETASDRQQMRDFIINSTKYWADEYHIDGFRFDLMAIHDIETMNQVAAALKEINPSIFVYGEGWTAGDSPLPYEQRALKDHVNRMPQVAVFSDDIRDAIKGHYSNAADTGFATGNPKNKETVMIGIVGATAHPQVDYTNGNNSKAPYANNPTQVINYVSCHDDLTLTDKLRKSMPQANDTERMRAARLAQTIVFTSQGTPFMFAGEELFRDKKGVHNSYNWPDSINAIDWQNKHLYPEQFKYYQELIKLRKNHPAFRMTTADQVAQHLVFDETPDKPLLISYSLKDHANGDEWEEIKLIFNGGEEAEILEIPYGNWKVIARDGLIEADGLKDSKGTQLTHNGGRLTVAPRSATILAR